MSVQRRRMKKKIERERRKYIVAPAGVCREPKNERDREKQPDSRFFLHDDESNSSSTVASYYISKRRRKKKSVGQPLPLD
jgi:hypothetical protein